MITHTLFDLPFLATVGSDTYLDSPARHPNMTFWYDATVLSSAVEDEVISLWPDRSVHHYDATGGSGPTFKTNIFGSRPALRWNGTSTFLTLPVTPVFADFTIIAVLQATATGGFYIGRSGVPFYLWINPTGGPLVRYFDTVFGINSNTLTGAMTDPRVVYVRLQGQILSFREATTSKGVFPNAVNPGFQVNTIAQANSSAYYQGDMAELIGYSMFLSDAVCDSLYVNYFKVKYTNLS